MSKSVPGTLSEEEWEKLCQVLLDDVSKNITHMSLGFLSAAREEPLHAQILLILPKKVTLTDTKTIGLSFLPEGLSLLINPNYYLDTLKTQSERIAVLRHVEQHLFLVHPVREKKFRNHCSDESLPFHQELYRVCCEIEAHSFIGGHVPIPGELTAANFSELPIPKAASAETLYDFFLPHWEQDPNYFLGKYHNRSCCDHQHWNGHIDRDENGAVVKENNIDWFTWTLFEKDIERVLVMARENLPFEQAKLLPEKSTERLNRILKEYSLSSSAPEEIKEASREIQAIMIKMLMKDPFFGEFLSSCMLQITDTISTAGVAVMKKYVALLVNPKFFMKNLKTQEERAAVLKHEALHIMLKHIIQMRNDKFPNKRLYNIAADLEVNQYVGAPWKLPDGALLLSTFPNVKLPENDVAETYYKILLKAAQDGKDKGLNQMLAEMGALGGHSDHGGWEDSSDDDGTGKTFQKGLHSASDVEAGLHEQTIERAVQQAADAVKSRHPGSIPGRFKDLLNEWMKARRPAIDWKRELRLFVSSNPMSEIKRTHRKKNKRYFRRLRETFRTENVSADALNWLARTNPEQLPQMQWNKVSEEWREIAYNHHPSLRSKPEDELIVWKELPLFVLWEMAQRYPEEAWPTWDDFTEEQLFRLRIIRTPLDPRIVSVDVIIKMAQQYAHLLPDPTWDWFTPTKAREIKKNYPHLDGLDAPVWGMLPSAVIVFLHQHKPELFQFGWDDVPPQLKASMPYFGWQGGAPYRIDRVVPKSLPGLQKKRLLPKILVIIDTSGSMSNTDIEYVFAEIDALYNLGVEVHVLQADTEPCLYFKYIGEKPIGGRGGTTFDPALQWLNNARTGVKIPVKKPREQRTEVLDVHLKVDGCIYLTDGYACTPTVKPYCRMMWILTPDGSGEAIKQFPHCGPVLTLPPYNNR